MDRMLKEKGKKSVLYVRVRLLMKIRGEANNFSQISFGSTFSTFIGFEKEVMWAWFDVVADMGIPVVSRTLLLRFTLIRKLTI